MVKVNYFYFLFSHENEKEAQLPLIPVYKMAYLLIFFLIFYSSGINLLVFSFLSSLFVPAVIDTLNFFSSFGLLVEAFFLTSFDSLGGLQQSLSLLQDPSIYMLYLINTNVAFRVLAVLFHSGVSVWRATFLVLLLPNSFKSNACTLGVSLGTDTSCVVMIFMRPHCILYQADNSSLLSSLGFFL